MRSLLGEIAISQPPEVLRKVFDLDKMQAILHDIPPIGMGTPAAPDDLPQCALAWNSTKKGAIGSGILVGKDTVLTAGHVQYEVAPNYISLDIADAAHKADHQFAACACGATDEPWGMTLYKLATGPGIEPVAIATTDEFENLCKQGGTVRLYGFGYGMSDPSAVATPGTKRYLDNVPILTDTPQLAKQIPGFDPKVMFVVGALGSSAPYAIACSGDSGGPAIAMIAGVPKLVGILQSVTNRTDGAGSLPGECGLATMAMLSRTDISIACA